jgi:hypothetical protein
MNDPTTHADRTSALPQLTHGPFIADGGLETSIIFQQGTSWSTSQRSRCSTPTRGATHSVSPIDIRRSRPW